MFSLVKLKKEQKNKNKTDTALSCEYVGYYTCIILCFSKKKKKKKKKEL